jgi:hypothetical protein
MKRILFLIITIFILKLNLFCNIGEVGWWIFRRPQPVKPKPLAIYGDLSGVFNNPAVCSTVDKKEVLFISDLSGFVGDSFYSVLYNHPVSFGDISFGIVYYDSGKETLYYMEDDEEKERTVSLQKDIMGFVCYGKKIKDDMFLGANLKFANSDIAEFRSANAVALDFGLIYLLKEKIKISFALNNIGTSTKFLEEKENLPLNLYLAGGYSFVFPKNQNLNLAVEFPYILEENRFIFALGLEYVIKMFSINFGYKFSDVETEGSAQFGFCISFIKNLNLSYTFVPAKYLSSNHKLSFSWKFN